MTRREAARRILHVLLGAGAFLVPLLGWVALAALCAAAAAANAWLLPRLAATRWLLRDARDGGRRGLVLYPVAVGVLALVFRDEHGPIQAGWLALAVGDGLAPFFGEVLRGPRWPWNAATMRSGCARTSLRLSARAEPTAVASMARPGATGTWPAT